MANLNVKTSFNTTLNLDNEAIGKRILAFLIDAFIIFLYYLLVVYILSQFNFDLDDAFDSDRGRIIWGWISILTLPAMFYTLIFEVITGGYTPGKFLVKIKVVKIDGFQPTFVDFFIRWIFRLVDIYLFLIIAISFGDVFVSILGFYSIGLVALVLISRNKKRQRLGDMVAGTTVIRAKLKQSMSITILRKLEQDYKPKYIQVMKLSDNDARIIKETFENAKKMHDVKLINKLVQKLEDVMNIKNQDDPTIFIDRVLKDFNYYTQNM
jgi:uncharacterized RDD family membrane protein YckC